MIRSVMTKPNKRKMLSSYGEQSLPDSVQIGLRSDRLDSQRAIFRINCQPDRGPSVIPQTDGQLMAPVLPLGAGAEAQRGVVITAYRRSRVRFDWFGTTVTRDMWSAPRGEGLHWPRAHNPSGDPVPVWEVGMGGTWGYELG